MLLTFNIGILINNFAGENNIESKGAEYIVKSLVKLQLIKEINLSRNCINGKEAEFMIELMNKCKALEVLILCI